MRFRFGRLLVFSFALVASGCGTTTTIPRVGYLDDGTMPSATLADHPFSQGLRDVGYVEGKNIVVEYKFADNDDDQLSAMAHELIAAHMAVL